MFVIFRPDPVHNSICLQYVFRAKHFFGVLVLAVGPQEFPNNRLAALFRVAAGRGLHLEQYTLLVRFFFRLNSPANAYQDSQQKNLFHRIFSHRLRIAFGRFGGILDPVSKTG